MSYALEMQQIHFAYPNAEPLFHDFSLTMGSGETVLICGANGAGKSSLLRLLAGYLKPQQGQIMLNGQALRGWNARQRACALAYVGQHGGPLSAHRVGEVVATGRYPHRGLLANFDRQDRQMIDQALELTGIAHLSERRLYELSGGERQLCMIARAFAQQSPIILLDEPTTWLDMNHAARLGRIFASWSDRDEKRLVIIASHDLNLLLPLASRLLIMKGGKMLNPASEDQQPNPGGEGRRTAELLSDAFGCDIGLTSVDADHGSRPLIYVR